MDEEKRRAVLALVPAMLEAMSLERWMALEGWAPSDRASDPVGTFVRRADEGARLTMSGADLRAEYQRERNAAVIRDAVQLVNLSAESEFYGETSRSTMGGVVAIAGAAGCPFFYRNQDGMARCSVPTGMHGAGERCAGCPRRPL